ncbi:unnamed protein product, partial [Scytosiphon promiscuus]
RTETLTTRIPGPMRVDGNMTDAPNYFPNSFSGPAAAEAGHAGWHADKATGDVARYPTGDDDNFTQAGEFFRRTLDEGGRQRLTDNIAGALVSWSTRC